MSTKHGLICKVDGNALTARCKCGEPFRTEGTILVSKVYLWYENHLIAVATKRKRGRR